jgi:creatinine amidohydrolase
MTDLGKLSWTDAKALIEGGCAAILPIGSTEAHGPHLPLDTDVTIALGMARRAAQKLAGPCVVLPAVAYSVTEFAAPFPGTLSLPRETSIAHLRDTLAGAVAMGFSPVAVANAHLEPAHIETIRAAIEAVAEHSGVTIVFPDVTRRRLAERLGDEFRSGACHAGRYEGSLVMADDPEAVNDELRRSLPDVPISLVDAIRAGHANFLAAGGTQAYFGSPAEASAEEGHATYEILASILVEAMESPAG